MCQATVRNIWSKSTNMNLSEPTFHYQQRLLISLTLFVLKKTCFFPQIILLVLHSLDKHAFIDFYKKSILTIYIHDLLGFNQIYWFPFVSQFTFQIIKIHIFLIFSFSAVAFQLNSNSIFNREPKNQSRTRGNVATLYVCFIRSLHGFLSLSL